MIFLMRRNVCFSLSIGSYLPINLDTVISILCLTAFKVTKLEDPNFRARVGTCEEYRSLGEI